MSKEQSDQEIFQSSELSPLAPSFGQASPLGGRLAYGGRAQSSVIVFGTFDLLHQGHIFFLNQAQAYGELRVMVSSDKRVKELKEKLPHENEKIRITNLNKAGFNAFLEQTNPLDDLLKYKPKVLVLGYDQHWEKIAFNSAKKAGLKLKIVKIDKAHKPHLYKSSVFRKSLGFKK